jgi:hypothetical protein
MKKNSASSSKILSFLKIANWCGVWRESFGRIFKNVEIGGATIND